MAGGVLAEHCGLCPWALLAGVGLVVILLVDSHGETSEVSEQTPRHRQEKAPFKAPFKAPVKAPGRASVKAPGKAPELVPVTAVEPAPKVLERRRGRFGWIFVVEEDGRRALRFGTPLSEDQSTFDPGRPDHEPLPYARLVLRALAWVKAPRRVLVVGLGGGSLLRHLRRLVPGAALEAVEIDPQVEPLARRWMGLGRAGRLRVHLEDGRAYLRRTKERYDLLVLDAFDFHDYPAHLGTRELFLLAASRLSPKGVLVANLSPNEQGTRANLVATFANALPGALCRVASPDTNTVVFGGPVVRSRPAAFSGRRFMLLARRLGGPRGLLGDGGAPCAFSLDKARILRDASLPRARPTPAGSVPAPRPR